MRKKIVILANESNSVYNQRNELLEMLTNKGFDVIIVCQVLKHKQDIIRRHCKILNLINDRRKKNPFNDLFLILKYLRIIRREKPFCVLTFSIKPNIYGGIACQIAKVPYVSNITGLGTAVENKGILQRITVPLYRIGVSRSSCIFFQNSDNMLFFQRHGMINKRSSAQLLPGSGVNLIKHQFYPYPDNTDTVHFLYVGRILEEKGIKFLLNAAKSISQKYTNACFHLCGGCEDAKLLSEIKLQSDTSSAIIYHGEQKDMINFYKMAHCIVHPSYYPEGMSNALLEAGAHGRPIITTNRAGCREAVEDGVTGYIIPIKDEKALYDALESFLKLSPQEKRTMGLMSRKRIESIFDRRIVVESYAKVLQPITHTQSSTEQQTQGDI